VTGGLYEHVVKRFIDTAAAACLLLLLVPLMAAVWLTVVCVLGSPAIYFDTRAGRNGRPIVIAKFRSMSLACGPDGQPLPDADRLGPFGRWLRRSSLDELPQLVSVLVGDMSLVGPRPLPLRYTPRYSPRQATRLQVRPGLTGWAQIHGRNGLDWPARLELDARYVEMLGTWYAPIVDMRILLVTFFQVAWQGLTGRGVTAPGAATMREFLP
jgi:lipopolysaccharide/colanic/teichoic acid biosynthesis glycosyltransferase